MNKTPEHRASKTYSMVGWLVTLPMPRAVGVSTTKDRGRFVGGSSSWHAVAFLFPAGLACFWTSWCIGLCTMIPSFKGAMWTIGSPVIWQRHWFGKHMKTDVSVRRWSMTSTPILLHHDICQQYKLWYLILRTSQGESPIQVQVKRSQWCSQNNLWSSHGRLIVLRRLHFRMTAL